jgi:hypothetical protein
LTLIITLDMCWRSSPLCTAIQNALLLFSVNFIELQCAIVHSWHFTAVSVQRAMPYLTTDCVQTPYPHHSLRSLGAELRRTTCPAPCILAPHCNSLPDQRNAPTVLFTKPYIQYDTPIHLSILYEGGDFGPSTNGCCDNGRSLQMRRRPIVWQHRDGRIVRRRVGGSWIANRDTGFLMLSCIGGLGFLGELALVDSLYRLRHLRCLSEPGKVLTWTNFCFIDKIAVGLFW